MHLTLSKREVFIFLVNRDACQIKRNKRSKGHITHLKKKNPTNKQLTQSYDYTITLINRNKKNQNVQRGHGLCMASESLLNIALYGHHQGKRKPLKRELIPPGEE